MQRITRRTLIAVLTLLGLAGAAVRQAGAEELFA